MQALQAYQSPQGLSQAGILPHTLFMHMAQLNNMLLPSQPPPPSANSYNGRNSSAGMNPPANGFLMQPPDYPAAAATASGMSDMYNMPGYGNYGGAASGPHYSGVGAAGVGGSANGENLPANYQQQYNAAQQYNVMQVRTLSLRMHAVPCRPCSSVGLLGLQKLACERGRFRISRTTEDMKYSSMQ